MAYTVTSSNVGVGMQPIATVSDVQNHPLGTIVNASDPTLGGGEFIYLVGLASTAVGDAVVYDEAYLTTRAVTTSYGPLAIAMSANVASKYGWYQISGLAIANAATVVADKPVSTTATPGQLDDLTTASQAVMGARWMSADGTPSAGKAQVMLARPNASGGTNIL